MRVERQGDRFAIVDLTTEQLAEIANCIRQVDFEFGVDYSVDLLPPFIDEWLAESGP